MDDTATDILIVDDNPANLIALEAVLAPLGERISKASSGHAALRLLLKQDFAVVLLDVRMPGLNGFETAELLRTNRRCEHTPIIFITAHGDEEHLARGYRLGAVDYILTPVVPEILRAKVGVFVDLFRKTAIVRRQSESLARRADQLLRLAHTALAVNGAGSIQGIVEVVVRELPALVDATGVRARVFSPGHPGHAGAIAESGSAIPTLAAVTSVPILSHDGTHVGSIEVAHGSSWAAEDDAVVVQLAQMTTVAVQNLLYGEEWEANRLKDEFLATLSHELRTPLNAILTWLALLRRGTFDASGIQRAIDVIERNARAQAKLIEDLLDMSRIISGKMHLNMAEPDMRAVVTAALEAVRPMAETRGVHVSAEFLEGPLVVLGDPERLQQVVWNLLTNAIKFTESGGRVAVRVTATEGSVEVEVNDTGSGIDPSFLPHVFDRFRQADSGSTRRHHGLGLGLAIVRNLMELHGGTVAAESAGEGHGSTFRVRIPCASRSRGNEPVEERRLLRAEPVAELAQSAVQLTGLRVLLVEDEPDAREATALLVTTLGASVQTAETVMDAVRTIDRWLPHVVVTDIGLPGEDGFVLLARIQEMEGTRGVSIPAVAVTAYARPEERLRVLAAGFRAHLGKPLDENTLRRILVAFLPPKLPASEAPADIDLG